MKKANELQPFSELPSALLWDILGRVSIKACLACKLVCKEWYHIIVSPEFSSFRRDCIPSRFGILFQDILGDECGFNFYMLEPGKALNVDDSGKCVMGVHDLVRFEKPNIDPSTEIWYVKSHCNGVVCFVSKKEDLFVCKLLTGQCMKLPNLRQERNESSHVGPVELGCCPGSGEFKVLLLLRDKAKNTQLAKIQTLGNGEWRSLGNAPFFSWKNGHYLNGSSHWCIVKCIWSFHFGKEKFSQIPLPDDVNNGSYVERSQKLSIFDSCLCLSCIGKSSNGVTIETNVWVMKEYGVKESWAKQFVIVTNIWCGPLAHVDKGNLFVRNAFNELYLYDPQIQVLKRVKFELDESSGIRVMPVAFDASFSRF